MNKGLEVIEACHLFDVDISAIDVVVHRQSIVHSMVEFVDGSVLAQMGVADMRIPIQYALTYPERLPSLTEQLDLVEIGTLTFEKPSQERFPCLSFAYEALKAGGTMPAVLNAANEIAVEYFLHNKVRFLDIPRIVEDTMAKHSIVISPTLEDILDADKWAREVAGSYVRD
jgi:1-deoxy-D-xylulose-5-phosphate reductoisomerase